MSSFQSQVGKDKAAMEEDYQKALELIFAYSYGCCMFKHNIYGEQPKILNDMPNSSDPLSLEFFVNPMCPSTPTATEVDQSEAAGKAEELERSAPTKDFDGESKFLLSLLYFFYFYF